MTPRRQKPLPKKKSAITQATEQLCTKALTKTLKEQIVVELGISYLTGALYHNA